MQPAQSGNPAFETGADAPFSLQPFLDGAQVKELEGRGQALFIGQRRNDCLQILVVAIAVGYRVFLHCPGRFDRRVGVFIYVDAKHRQVKVRHSLVRAVHSLGPGLALYGDGVFCASKACDELQGFRVL